ncbi:cytochrome P450 [Streptomyces lydicus]|uniref:cytochrome P450 n=1 Tax=Streptomyces lydicus TaxID=47763 RepID=UPI0037AE68DD
MWSHSPGPPDGIRAVPSGAAAAGAVSTRVTVAGRVLEPGTTLASSPYTIHSRPDLFDQPQQFSPDRWLPENVATLPRGTFVGYGRGARRCIGDEYGMQGTALALATIAVRWRLELARGTDSRPLVTGPALRPRSLQCACMHTQSHPTPRDHESSDRVPCRRPRYQFLGDLREYDCRILHHVHQSANAG